MSDLKGGAIAAISPGSIAADLAWQPGDRLLSLNGHPLRDVIDYRFYQADDYVVAEVDHDSHTRTYDIHKDPDEDLGVEFADGLFDRLRTCRNDCPFCFLKGLPAGLRRTLYLRDDDYRYSFLFGNFITLTNLTEADWQRIASQRLSPLYISVHTTDPALRRQLLGNPRAPDVLAQIRRLGELRIQVHTQIVLVPPLNTGDALARSVRDLGALHPVVQSIGVVPVGLTSLSGSLRPLTTGEARQVVGEHLGWRLENRGKKGVGLVYIADELFLRAGARIPGRLYYEGFPQLENGIGLVRLLLDDWHRVKRRGLPGKVPGQDFAVACGTLIAPVLQRLAGEWNALSPARCQLVAVANRLFGESVTVSGLLAGRDVLAQAASLAPGQTLFLPRAMFDAAGRLTLDDHTPETLAAALGRPVRLAGCFGDICEALGKGLPA